MSDDALAQVTPQVLMDLMRQLVAESMERTQRGEMPDLAPVERGIAAMCDKITRMPPAESREFKDSLGVLLKEVDTLASLLASKRGEIMEETQKLDLHKKANTAYRSATHHYGGKVITPDDEPLEE